MTASGIDATPSTRRRRRDGAARDAARSPEHLVLLGRVEGQSTLEHREEEDPEGPPVDGEVVGLGLRLRLVRTVATDDVDGRAT